jgi:hypothetical protein
MRVRLTRLAEAELTEAMEWYDAQASGLGARFSTEFEALTAASEIIRVSFHVSTKRSGGQCSTAFLMDCFSGRK